MIKELGLTRSWLSPHLCLNSSSDLVQDAALHCIAGFFLGGNILRSAAFTCSGIFKELPFVKNCFETY